MFVNKKEKNWAVKLEDSICTFKSHFYDAFSKNWCFTFYSNTAKVLYFAKKPQSKPTITTPTNKHTKQTFKQIVCTNIWSRGGKL